MDSPSRDDIVIVAAMRTPVGSFSGALGTLSAHALGTVALQAAFERAGVTAADVDEVILGQVLTANQGQNPPPVKHVVFYALKGPENTNSHWSECNA